MCIKRENKVSIACKFTVLYSEATLIDMSTTLNLHGCRGTIPIEGDSFSKYSGLTTCFSIERPEGLIIFDAGTGLQHLQQLKGDHLFDNPVSLFFTHFHMDHIVGLPGFLPLYQKGNHFTFLCHPTYFEDWQSHLDRFMDEPYWPITIKKVPSLKYYEDLNPVAESIHIYDTVISWHKIPHTSACLAYRVEFDNTSIVIATDCEISTEEQFDALVDFAKEADILLLDAQYTPDEMELFAGYGHNSWESAAKIGKAAEVKKLILTHHDPARSDKDLDAIALKAQAVFPPTEVGASGQQFTF